MEAYPQEDYDYAYEHDVRNIIEESKEEESEEESKKGTRVRSFYDPKTNTWEVEINYGDYIFKGKVSPKGIPTEGVISHKNENMFFKDNQDELSPKGFAHTIMCIFQDKINERIQKYYAEEEEEEEECNASTRYINDRDIIQEEDGESSSEEEGNVIHEEPTQPIQQHQNQSNLNLKSNRNRKFGRSNSK